MDSILQEALKSVPELAVAILVLVVVFTFLHKMVKVFTAHVDKKDAQFTTYLQERDKANSQREERTIRVIEQNTAVLEHVKNFILEGRKGGKNAKS